MHVYFIAFRKDIKAFSESSGMKIQWIFKRALEAWLEVHKAKAA